MDATIPRRRPPGMAALLAAVAVIAVAPTLMTGSGTHAQALAGAAGSGLAAAVAGTLIRKASRDEDAWPSGAGIAWAMFLIAAVSFAYLAIGSTSDTANHPRPADALLLLLLIPLTIAMRDELRVHFDTGDRREIAIDVMLIAASVGAILYLLIRPPGAGPTESGVAGVIAILAASQFTSFAALTLWEPTVSHLLQFLAFAGYSIATVLFGWVWTRDGGGHGDPWMNAIYVLSPVLLAAVLILVPHGVPVPRTKLRLARPILSSVSIVTACGALASVAILGDAKAIGSLQSTLLIVLLGGGIAARVVANQVASTQAHQTVEEALTRRETALRGAPAARVRRRRRRLRRTGRGRRRRPGERGVRRDGGHGSRRDRGAAMVGGGGGGPRLGCFLRAAPRDGTGQHPTAGRPAAVHRIADLPGADGSPSPASTGARRHVGQGRRPDDPLAVPVPPGPGRGPDEAPSAHELGDRTGAEPDRARPS